MEVRTFSVVQDLVLLKLVRKEIVRAVTKEFNPLFLMSDKVANLKDSIKSLYQFRVKISMNSLEI